MCGNRVDELEEQVQELQATVDGLTDELVECKVRIRELENAVDSEDPLTRADNAIAEREAAEAAAEQDTEPEPEPEPAVEPEPADTSKSEGAEADENESDEAESESDIIIA